MSSPFVPLTVRRSSIPLVVGILAITFSLVGIASSALFTWGANFDLTGFLEDGARPSYSRAQLWLLIWMAVSVVLFVLHLAGGILSTGYRSAGRRLLTAYAVGALALIAIDVVMIFALNTDRRFHISVFKPHLVYSVLAVGWPLAVLLLVNSRGAKAAAP